MRKSANTTNRTNGPVVSITSVGESTGVPLDGVLLEEATLEEAVENAVGQMDWLKPSDRAMVELALSYARQIDMANLTAVTAADQLRNLEGFEPDEVAPLLESANKALASSMKAHYLGPHLHNALKSLGGDPGARAEITGASPGVVEKPADPLSAMRAKRRGA